MKTTTFYLLQQTSRLIFFAFSFRLLDGFLSALHTVRQQLIVNIHTN